MMNVIDMIIKRVSVESIMQQVDGALDPKLVSRTEQMDFLRGMLQQVELRMGWIRDAMREEAKANNK